MWLCNFNNSVNGLHFRKDKKHSRNRNTPLTEIVEHEKGIL